MHTSLPTDAARSGAPEGLHPAPATDARPRRVALPLAAGVLAIGLAAWEPRLAEVFFFAAVAGSAAAGGLWGGSLATLVMLAGVFSLFLAQGGSVLEIGALEILRSMAYIGIGMVIAIAGERLRGARWRDRQREAAFQEIDRAAEVAGRGDEAVEEQRAELFHQEHEARTAAEASERRSSFLAEVTRELAGSLDYEATLQRVARLSVPELATCSLIYVMGEDGWIHAAAAAHADPACEARLARLQGGAIAPTAGHIVASAIRSEQPVLLSGGRPRWAELFGLTPEQCRVLEELAIHSAAIVPLHARGEVLGAIALLAGGRGWLPLGEDDLRMAERMAQSAALAVDNARLFREAHQATRAREEVLSVVAHDLRSPLGAISVSTELLMGFSLEPREQMYHLEIIQRASARMSRLIQDLVDVAKIEAGRLSIEPYLQEAEPLVTETLEMLRTRAQTKMIELWYEMPDGMVQIHADRYRILQVLSNLVENAIKFTPAGGEVGICVEDASDGTRISVRDTGPGIAADAVSRIFDRYWQAENKPGKGAGLGLAIVRGIVEAHGGRIWVESEEGAGATFTLVLPRPDRDAEGRGADRR